MRESHGVPQHGAARRTVMGSTPRAWLRKPQPLRASFECPGQPRGLSQRLLVKQSVKKCGAAGGGAEGAVRGRGNLEEPPVPDCGQWPLVVLFCSGYRSRSCCPLRPYGQRYMKNNISKLTDTPLSLKTVRPASQSKWVLDTLSHEYIR